MTSTKLQKSMAFAELLHQHHGDLFSFIYSLVLNQADAEDLYQEAAVVLWRKFDEFEPGTDFRRWAIRVAHLKVLNFVRLHRRRRMLFSDDVLQTIADSHQREEGAAQARREALQACVKKLASHDQRLVDSRYSHQQSISEIAGAEGRSSDAIYKALSRIRLALLQCIERRLSVEGR
jgi:RNA polymerase sigma-70 factor, ECF subfamily